MTWPQRDAPNGKGAHGGGPRDGWMRQFLRRDAERQVAMLDSLHARLEGQLKELKGFDLPDKEWVRVAQLRLDGYRVLATLELEAAKVYLMAERAKVHAPMSDEEFATRIQELGRQAVAALPAEERARSLSVEELEAELARKRALPAPTSDPGRIVAPKEET